MDVYSSNWVEDDNSNSSAAPGGAPEGMAPGGINDVLRAHQGAIKRYVNQQSPKTTAGTSTAFTLSYSTAPGALVDGMTHLVQFNAANGLAPTLNVNSLGAMPLHYYSAGAWRVIPTGLIDADDVLRVAYNSSSGAYRILHLKNRTGEIIPFAGSTAPAGALLCYGQAISRTDYVGLFTAIGTTYGVGNGTTTFNLPDLRGRVAAGKDDMGGSSAARLDDMSSTTLGATGGNQRTSTMDGPNTTSSVQSGPGATVASFAHIHGNVRIVQPTLILNYLIRIQREGPLMPKGILFAGQSAGNALFAYPGSALLPDGVAFRQLGLALGGGGGRI
jgi:microcystin-dependent protein